MTGRIFRKELMDMLSDWRFFVFAAMLVLLGLIVTVARSADHEQAVQDYSDAEVLHSRKLKAPLYARGLSDVEVEQQVDSTAVKRIWARFREEKRVENAAHELSLVQGAITAVVAHTSPFAAYVVGGTEISGVGVASAFSYLQFDKGQGAAMRQYLQDKWKAAAKADPETSRSTILDTRDRPKGVYRGDPFAYRMAGDLLPFLSLALANVLFFVLAWRRFLRYDVR